MEYDNERDRYAHGFDAGQIVDGKVMKDPDTGRIVVMDEEGVGFDPQAALETLMGEEVRITMISHRSMVAAQELLERSQGSKSS